MYVIDILGNLVWVQRFQFTIVVYLDQYLCIMYNLDNPFTIHDKLRIYVYLTYYDVLNYYIVYIVYSNLLGTYCRIIFRFL